MTPAQTKVLYWLATHEGWHQSDKICRGMGTGAVTRVLKILVMQGRVEVKGYTTIGGAELLYRANSTIKLARKARAVGGR